jgi:peptidoglycan/xylan/chitin deacetylase (PgdA/CDA1 family)
LSRRWLIAPPLLLLAASACGADEHVAQPPGAAEPGVMTAPRWAPHEMPRDTFEASTFPDHVLSLTWDDGPDASTLALATYLKKERVSATFFVVGDWVKGVSADPGVGRAVFESGYLWLPVLSDLVELGHRLGNHTMHHVLLGGADAKTVRDELLDNQRAIDPYLTTELRLFRAPGGSWSAEADAVVARDASLSRAVGPVPWNVDNKDWEGSLYCRSSHPEAECEAAPHVVGREGRVRASVIAQRYVAAIESAGHGIVLFHDRVGHVGSRYAVDVAALVVPQLKARGFVFAAPVLRFSPLVRRLDLGAGWPSLAFADIDGDGRGDVCGAEDGGVSCAFSTTRSTPSDRIPRTVFRRALGARRSLQDVHDALRAGRGVSGGALHLADVDGDRQADLCVKGALGLACALADARGAFGSFREWSRAADFADDAGRKLDDVYSQSIRFGDLDGDGRADVCGRAPGGVVCARSLGSTFDAATLRQPELGDAQGWRSREHATSMQLADVDGDGLADLCARGETGIVCARSTGHGFTRLERWSAPGDFADDEPVAWAAEPSYWSTIRFGDLNGDGRADVCGRGPSGLVCALSTGRAFTRASVWLSALSDADGGSELATSFALADVNGDGRADACARARTGVVCGLAP